MLIYRSRRGSRNFFTEFSCHCGIGAIISFLRPTREIMTLLARWAPLAEVCDFRMLRSTDSKTWTCCSLSVLDAVPEMHITVDCTWSLIVSDYWGTRCIIAYHFLCTVDRHIFCIYRILILAYRPINAVQDTRIIGRVSYWQPGPRRLCSC